MQAFGKPQDIEWAIDDSGVYILQSRPITKHLNVMARPVVGNVLPVSIGRCVGKPWFDVDKIPKEDVVLIAPYIELKDFDRIVSDKNIKGIITEFGGMLSHEAIIAREKGIPYLAGMSSSAISSMENAKLIELNTERLSVIADGAELISSDPITYGWLNKNLKGLSVARVEKVKGGVGEVVFRNAGDFAIIYSEISSRKSADNIAKAIWSANERGEKVMLCDTMERTHSFVIKIAINALSHDVKFSPVAESLLSAVENFDILAFDKAYDVAILHLKTRVAEAMGIFHEYEVKKNDINLENACRAALHQAGIYRYIRTLPQYFEFALGDFMSKKEGRLITDLELYKLKNDYCTSFENIGRMSKRLEDMIIHLDNEIPMSEDGEDSIARITNLLVSEAKRYLGKDNELFPELPLLENVQWTE